MKKNLKLPKLNKNKTVIGRGVFNKNLLTLHNQNSHKRTRAILTTLVLTTVLLMGTISFAYFAIKNSDKYKLGDLSTGTMALRFMDNDNGIRVKLHFGESVTKKFIIENTGTLEASASLDWKNLTNSYLNRSLTYTLSYSDTEEGEYKIISPKTNVPVSATPIRQTIESEISVPAGAKYYYNLTITLNDLPDVEQSSDLNAEMNSEFIVDVPSKYRYYTLEIDPNGGTWNDSTGIYSAKMKNGETFTVSNPTRYGYNFKGWEVYGQSSTLEGEEFKMGISDSKLTAIWESAAYTLTIDPDGGVYEGDLTHNLLQGETAEISTPTKEGYTFTGWIYETGNLSGNTFTMGAGDVTLTATWQANNYKYIVYHSQMDLDGENYTLVEADTDEGEAEYNTTIIPKTKEYIGFTSPELIEFVIQVEEDYPPTRNKIDYLYSRNKYTLTVNPNGGTYAGPTSEEMYYQSSIELPIPTKEGHNFAGWEASSGTMNDNTFVMGTEDATVDATYTLKTATVYFNANGGTTETQSKIVTYTQNYGELPTPTYNKYTGYEFLGWFTDPENGTQVESTTQVDTYADHTLYAHWKATKFYIPQAVTAMQNNEVPDGVRTEIQSFDGVSLTPEVVETFTVSPDDITYYNDATGNNPVTCKYSACYNNLAGKYLDSSKKILEATPDYYIYEDITDVVNKVEKSTPNVIVYSDTYTSSSGNKNLYENFSTCTGSECDASIIGKYYIAKTTPGNVQSSYTTYQYKIVAVEDGCVKAMNIHGSVIYYHDDYPYLIYADDIIITKEGGAIFKNPQSCDVPNCPSNLNGKYAKFYETASDRDNYLKKNTPTVLMYLITYSSNLSYDANFVNTISGSLGLNYYRYADSYKTNSNNNFELVNSTSCQFESCYNNFKGKYLSDLTSADLKDSSTLYKVINTTPTEFVYHTIYRNDSPLQKRIEFVNNYTFDQNTKKFSLTGVEENGTYHDGLYENLYSEAAGKYLIKLNETEYGTLNNNGGTSDLDYIYRIAAATPTEITLEKLAATKVEEGTYDESNNGVYSMKDAYGDSYFYRGSVVDNYVKFAGLYWRVLRVNGDGSVRMVYDGTRARPNGSTLSLPINSKWTTAQNDNKYVGWQYGPSGTTKSTSKTDIRNGTTNSLVKTAVESWYTTNIANKTNSTGTAYSTYVQESKFCNDKSTPGYDSTGYANDTGLGYGTNLTGYGALARYVDTQSGWISRLNVQPNLACPEAEDYFTGVVGLMTTDEVIVAGGGWKFNNKVYFLYTGVDEWLMTPFRYSTHARMMMLSATGELGDNAVPTTGVYARPVINIKAEYAKNFLGDGTATNPYRISGETL